jgi:transposase
MQQNHSSLNGFMGIDVSKSHLDIFDGSTATHHHIPNTARSIRAWLKKHATVEACIVYEATGGYEKTLQTALQSHAHLNPERIHPAQVKSYARALGKRAKTDKIDAEMLTRAAAYLGDDLHDTTAPDHAQLLRELLMRKKQLQEMLHAEKCRMQMPELPPMIARSLTTSVKRLQHQLDDINQHISECIRAEKTLNARSKRLQQVQGVGEQVAATVIAFLPELGTVGRKEIAALAGLAPITRQSGTSTGRGRTQGGRQPLKQALYMAALVGIRYNPTLKNFYQSLLQKQKPKMVALIATARKLVTHLNAIEKNARTTKILS